jgi:hypothetical protein
MALLCFHTKVFTGWCIMGCVSPGGQALKRKGPNSKCGESEAIAKANTWISGLLKK